MNVRIVNSSLFQFVHYKEYWDLLLFNSLSINLAFKAIVVTSGQSAHKFSSADKKDLNEHKVMLLLIKQDRHYMQDTLQLHWLTHHRQNNYSNW